MSRSWRSPTPRPSTLCRGAPPRKHVRLLSQNVVSPYAPEGAAQGNAAESTAFASVAATDDVVLEDVREVVEHHQSATLEVAAGGQAFSAMPEPSHGTEAIGIIAALVILAPAPTNHGSTTHSAHPVSTPTVHTA